MFLYNGEQSYSYADLLKAVCMDDYVPLLKTHDLFKYFSNLIKALVNNKPLVLLDSDLSLSELGGINEEKINVIEKLRTQKFSSMDEVVKALQQSASEITIFTSGTTGQPKKVIHSVQGLTRSVRCAERYQWQVWAYAYNPTHMAGLQVFFQAFENQNTLVNVFGLARNEVYSLIEKYSVTHISATPTFYRLLLPFAANKDPASVEAYILFILARGNMSCITSKRCRSLFSPPKVIRCTEEYSFSKGDCFQIPVSIRDKFMVVDDELLIHRSLLGRSESFSFDGDYYHSNDLIEWVDQQEGIFRFKSRKNELINVGGYKVNPGEVEVVINAIDGIRQSLVYGKSNSVLGNVLCADIQLEEGVLLKELDIRCQLKNKLQDFKIPRRIKFVESFALTRTGKLKRL